MFATAAQAASPAPAIDSPVCRSFERPGTAVDAAIAALPDGTVWYADKRGNRLMRIHPDRVITPLVPTDGSTGRLSGIALGTDGNVWYTKDTGNRVGRVPPGGGEGLEFAVPETQSLPSGLLADRSGQLWFRSQTRHYIGRLAIDGSVVVHRGPTVSSRNFSPIDMAAGPDGNLWTTDHGHNAIYRFDVASGAFTRFDIPTPNAQPGAITDGADGNLWFTMFAARKVGRITPQGVITEYALGALDGGAPKGIVATADGSVWVTTSGRLAARIRRDGSVQAFPCGQNLGSAIVGSRGAPWFFGGDRIWVVEDAGAAQPARPVQAAPATGAPWPVAAAGGAAAVDTLTLRAAIDRLPTTRGRVALQLTSLDPNCGFCIAANPTFDAIAARRAAEARFWRVTYEPWQSVSRDPDFNATGAPGLPVIIVFENGTEIRRIHGTRPQQVTESEILAPR